MEAPAGGGRQACAMAGLIEEVKWRTPQSGKGNRYLLVTLSDTTGQYVASCFDEDAQMRLETAARDGVAILVQTEELTKQNKELTSKLAGAAGGAMAAETLRQQLATVQAELATSKQVAAEVDALTKQNLQLRTELAAHKDQVARLAQTRAELAESNKNLNSQLDENKKTPFVRPQSVGESSEIAQLKSQLDEARANGLRAEKATARVEDLIKQNESLQQQLDAAHTKTK